MHAKSIFNRQNLLYGLIFSITATIDCGALAQATNQAIYLPPGQSSQGMLPPPGSGATPAPVTPGDAQTQDVPSGRITAAPPYGTNLGHENEKRRSRINLMMNVPNTGTASGGTQVVLTFEPDNLTSQQKSAVMGIIGATDDNVPYQNITVTQEQLVEMQNILAPSPDAPEVAGTSDVPITTTYGTVKTRSQIFNDTPSPNALQHGTNGEQPQFPIIRTFCRYLVILGVVCGCLFMAFAAISLQFGDRNAGGRIIGAAGGVMLLLMSYSIWKVVRHNEDNARGPANRVVNGAQPMEESRSEPGDELKIKSNSPFTSTTDANLPVTPTNPGGIQRSGLPLQPLGDEH